MDDWDTLVKILMAIGVVILSVYFLIGIIV